MGFNSIYNNKIDNNNMLWILTLLGWIAGISMMGRNLPNTISSLLPILIIFSCIIIALTGLKRRVKPRLSSRFIFIQAIVLVMTSFFWGMELCRPCLRATFSQQNHTGFSHRRHCLYGQNKSTQHR